MSRRLFLKLLRPSALWASTTLWEAFGNFRGPPVSEIWRGWLDLDHRVAMLGYTPHSRFIPPT